MTELDSLTSLGRSVPSICHLGTQHTDFVRWSKSESSQTQEHCYNATVMSHAKVYAIANFAGLPILKQLAHHRLADTLLSLGRHDLGPEASLMVADLARYVYANTDGFDEPLRQIVSSFIAINIDRLDTAVTDVLIQEGGECVVNIVNKVRERFSLHRKRPRDSE